MDECRHPAVDTQLTLSGCKFDELHDICSFGGRADVLCGILNSFAPHKVAVKAFRRVSDVNEDAIENELRIWRLLGIDSHIASFVGIAPVNLFDEKYFAKGPVSDHCAQGNLKVYLGKKDQIVANHRLRFQLLSGATEGLKHIHAHSIVHGDLKAQNILVDGDEGNQVARICDFGSSRVNCTCNSSPREQVGTLPWDSPELWMPQGDGNESPLRTQKSDVWAFGCVALEVQMGLTPWDPFKKYRPAAMRTRQFNAQAGPPATAVDPNLNLGGHSIKQRVWDLMVRCWSADPEQRPTAIELLAEMQNISMVLE